eukprot:s87_g41.t1
MRGSTSTAKHFDVYPDQSSGGNFFKAAPRFPHVSKSGVRRSAQLRLLVNQLRANSNLDSTHGLVIS